MRGSGTLGYRCPAAPKSGFIRKGGDPEEAEGKKCLCNGLLATVGLGRLNIDGNTEAPLITLGDDLRFLDGILADGAKSYSAVEAVAFISGVSAVNTLAAEDRLQAC